MTREARYDLQYQIANNDFFFWLVMAKAHGAQGVVFGAERVKETKWPETEVIRRLNTLLIPGCALAQLPFRIGEGGSPGMGSPMLRDFVHFVRTEKWDWLRPPPPNFKADYTVTLREHWRNPERNSRVKEWRRFADTIGAFVIEDYDNEPRDLTDVIAIMAAAEMNFGVNTGPMTPATLCALPVTIFVTAANASNFRKHGVEPGTQFPYRVPGQTLVWAEDTYDELMKQFDRLMITIPT